MQEELLQLFTAVRNPETVQEAGQALLEVLNNPEVFDVLVQILLDPTNSLENRKSSAIYFKIALQNQLFNEGEANEELAAYARAKLLELLFTINDSSLIDLIILSVELILTNSASGLNSWPELFPAALQGVSNAATVASSINIVNVCIKFIPIESIAESMEQFLKLIEAGINYESWPVRAYAFDIFEKIVPLLVESGTDVSGFIATFLSYPHDAEAFADNKYLASIWSSLSVVCANNLVAEEQLNAIYLIAMEIAANGDIDIFTRNCVFYITSIVLPELDEEQLNNVLEANFSLAIELLNRDGVYDELLVQVIEAGLIALDTEKFYSMIKEKLERYLQTEDVNAHVFCIHVIAETLIYSPEAARQDTEFINETLIAGIDSENTDVQQAVCEALDCLDETFDSVQVFASTFILKVLPLLASEDPNLSTKAFLAAHCLGPLLDGEVEGYFQLCWELHEALSTPENFESFASIFAHALSVTDISDEDLDAVLEYVSPFFGEEVDIDYAAPVLIIVGEILNKDEAQAETLLQPAMEMTLRALDSSNDQTQINALDFIDAIFPLFSEVIMTDFRIIVKKIRGIAQYICDKDDVAPEEVEGDGDEEEQELEPPSDTEDVAAPEEEDDEEGESQVKVNIAAVYTASKIAKILGNRRYASEMQECIIEILSEDETIASMYDAAKLITKLLGRNDSKQLFLNLHDIIIDEKDPRTVGNALAPYTKLIKYSCEKNKELFVESAYSVIQAFFNGELPSTYGKKPLDDGCDYTLMTNIAYLITEIVKVPNREAVDQLCESMLEIIKVPGHIASYSFLAAYTDAIQYDACSPEAVEALFGILSDLIESAQEPDIMQNICFLLNTLAKKNEELIEGIMEYFPAVAQWYEVSVQQESGYQNLLSNIASLYLTLACAVPTFPDEAIVAALQQYPPFDTSETSPMTDMIIKFLTTRSEYSGDVLATAIISICNVLVMPPNELEENKITQEQLTSLSQLFVTTVSSSQEMLELVQSQFAKSKTKLTKLLQILGQ